MANPIEKQQIARFNRSCEFIKTCILLMGSDFSIDKKFSSYSDNEGKQKYSNEACIQLDKSLREAVYMFDLFNTSLVDFYETELKRTVKDEKHTNNG